jgi:hypothetical protein
MEEKLVTRQSLLLNRAPTEAQRNLYREAPKRRGFMATHWLTAAQEAELFEAVFLLALSQTFREGPETVSHVYLFVPANLEGWAAEQIRRIAAEMFGICRAQKAVPKAKHLGELMQRLLIGSKLSSTTTEPDCWAAYGFDEKAKVPGWLIEKLLPIEPYLRDA